MGARWFCNICDEEIWKNLDEEKKKTETVYELEQYCLCSNCIIKKFAEVSENNKSNMVSE